MYPKDSVRTGEIPGKVKHRILAVNEETDDRLQELQENNPSSLMTVKSIGPEGRYLHVTLIDIDHAVQYCVGLIEETISNNAERLTGVTTRN